MIVSGINRLCSGCGLSCGHISSHHLHPVPIPSLKRTEVEVFRAGRDGGSDGFAHRVGIEELRYSSHEAHHHNFEASGGSNLKNENQSGVGLSVSRIEDEAGHRELGGCKRRWVHTWARYLKNPV